MFLIVESSKKKITRCLLGVGPLPSLRKNCKCLICDSDGGGTELEKVNIYPK